MTVDPRLSSKTLLCGSARRWSQSARAQPSTKVRTSNIIPPHSHVTSFVEADSQLTLDRTPYQDSTDYAALSRNGVLGLRILSLLRTRAPRGGLVSPTRALLSVIAFTNRRDPWTSDSCAEIARSLLSETSGTIPLPRLPRDAGAAGGHSGEKTTPGTDQARFITEDVLTGFLRPLFVKSRPTTVTASGRPAAFPEPPPRYSQGDGFGGGGGDMAATKPWKYARRYAVTVFAWAVENADVSASVHDPPLDLATPRFFFSKMKKRETNRDARPTSYSGIGTSTRPSC